MSLRKVLPSAATLAAFIVGMAVFLAAQDTSAYPTLDNMPFWCWLLLSAGIVAVIALPGLAIFGIVIVAKWLLAIAFQRRPDSGPTPPDTPAPAAANPADIEDEWDDIRLEIAAEWAESSNREGK